MPPAELPTRRYRLPAAQGAHDGACICTQGARRSGKSVAREWPRPAVDVQKHYGYAFQWFALGALMAGLYVWFQLVRPRLGKRSV